MVAGEMKSCKPHCFETCDEWITYVLRNPPRQVEIWDGKTWALAAVSNVRIDAGWVEADFRPHSALTPTRPGEDGVWWVKRAHFEPIEEMPDEVLNTLPLEFLWSGIPISVEDLSKLVCTALQLDQFVRVRLDAIPVPSALVPRALGDPIVQPSKIRWPGYEDSEWFGKNEDWTSYGGGQWIVGKHGTKEMQPILHLNLVFPFGKQEANASLVRARREAEDLKRQQEYEHRLATEPLLQSVHKLLSRPWPPTTPPPPSRGSSNNNRLRQGGSNTRSSSSSSRTNPSGSTFTFTQSGGLRRSAWPP